MSVGDIYELSIPPALAFGTKGRRASAGKPSIPAGAYVTVRWAIAQVGCWAAVALWLWLGVWGLCASPHAAFWDLNVRRLPNSNSPRSVLQHFPAPLRLARVCASSFAPQYTVEMMELPGKQQELLEVTGGTIDDADAE